LKLKDDQQWSICHSKIIVGKNNTSGITFSRFTLNACACVTDPTLANSEFRTVRPIMVTVTVLTVNNGVALVTLL
jgi:hypothetical protein